MQWHNAPFPLRRLPPEAERILATVDASPRLIAHLALVHEAACEIVNHVARAWPTLTFDAEAVRIVAATHDAGKVQVPEEMSQPGHRHEAIGEALLLGAGLPPEHARFARTHGGAARGATTLEDWLVMLADAVWKGAQPREVEDSVVGAISARTGEEPWAVFLRLDAILDAVAANAPARLG